MHHRKVTLYHYLVNMQIKTGGCLSRSILCNRTLFTCSSDMEDTNALGYQVPWLFFRYGGYKRSWVSGSAVILQIWRIQTHLGIRFGGYRTIQALLSLRQLSWQRGGLQVDNCRHPQVAGLIPARRKQFSSLQIVLQRWQNDDTSLESYFVPLFS